MGEKLFVASCFPKSGKKPCGLYRVVWYLATRPVIIIDSSARSMILKPDVVNKVFVPLDRPLKKFAPGLPRQSREHGDGAPIALHGSHQMFAFRKRIGPCAFGRLQRERRRGSFKRDFPVTLRARAFEKHPVGENPISLGLHKYIIIPPRKRGESALQESPNAQIEAHATVRAG